MYPGVCRCVKAKEVQVEQQHIRLTVCVYSVPCCCVKAEGVQVVDTHQVDPLRVLLKAACVFQLS